MKSDYWYPLLGALASLLWVYVSFRYFVFYRGLAITGEGDQVRNRLFLKIAQLFLLVSSLVFTFLLFNLFNLSRTAAPPPASATSVMGGGTDQLSPTSSPFAPIVPTPSPESSPTPDVIPGTGFARVGNTNGFGANVRSEPGLEYELLAQLSDGSRVELTSEVQSADGFTWQRVRLEDGRLGWIANNFLIPEP